MSEQPLMRGAAQDLLTAIRNDPIVSPHGHCDPGWFASNNRFSDPADLLVVPDHYLFRMLYSQGIRLEDLGIGIPQTDRNPKKNFKLFAQHWHLFLGTPSRVWLDDTLANVFDIDTPLSGDSADQIYDAIDGVLGTDAFRPRALFDRFNIETLATTDAATDELIQHQAIKNSDWSGHVIPTFRPDAVLDPTHDQFSSELTRLEQITTSDMSHFDGYLDALRQRRQVFIALGATATDHAIETIQTEWLDKPEIMALYDRVRSGDYTRQDAARFYAHMLVEMAQMSVDDGLVMQIHAGSRRNTNSAIMKQFGRDMGADIPVATHWVTGLDALLNRVGNTLGFRLILFTLDETTYARELAPMAGHWPCLRIGPPWWFHDSPAGIARYFDQVVETAGYWNLAGFNDDTRAFLSIPARHAVWRQGVARHLGSQVDNGVLGMNDASHIAHMLSTDLARTAYRLDGA